MDYLTKIFRIYEFILILKDQFTFRQLIKLQRINRSICWIINDHTPRNLIWKVTDDYDRFTEDMTYGIQIFIKNQRDETELIHQWHYYAYSDLTVHHCMVESIFQNRTLYHIDSEYIRNIIQIFESPHAIRQLNKSTIVYRYMGWYDIWNSTVAREEIEFYTTSKYY